MSTGLGSASPFVLWRSALFGDSLWVWLTSCFTILQHRSGTNWLELSLNLRRSRGGWVYLLDHQLGDALTIPLVIEPNTVDPHYKAQNNGIITCATCIPTLANDWLTSNDKIYVKYRVGGGESRPTNGNNNIKDKIQTAWLTWSNNSSLLLVSFVCPCVMKHRHIQSPSRGPGNLATSEC